MLDKRFWRNKRVFVTGHTGFKGAWLCLWLNALGAKVTGYALEPPTEPSLFELCKLDKLVKSIIADVRDIKRLKSALFQAKPEIIFHLAAQPIVRKSYKVPVETFDTNVMGTVNLFEAIRKCRSIRSVVIITSDKCYENRFLKCGYRESDPLGGYDPYSGSKACQEIVAAVYRSSYFNPVDYRWHRVGVASARAGNVIGGGDWARDRLVADFIRAVLSKKTIAIRNPNAVRPWQHVLDPLYGYMVLAQRLYQAGQKYTGAWNFGPHARDAKSVEWLIKKLCAKWGQGCSYRLDGKKHPHEANYLKLDCSKASQILGWHPQWNLGKAIEMVVEWTKAYQAKENLRQVSLDQIKEYEQGK